MARGKILLALQFWKGDKDMAMDLAKVIARNEPKHCELADFLFVSRHDCAHDQATVREVSRKFNTRTYRSPRTGVGWPAGCNDLWFATMEWALCHQQARRTDYKAILTFEADSCPLVPDWIEQLSDEWDRKKAKVVGSIQPQPWPHVNGNALFTGEVDFLHWLVRKVFAVPAHSGWDCYLADAFKRRGWANTNKMQSIYKLPNLPADCAEEMVRHGVVFLHGVRNRSVQEYFGAKVRLQKDLNFSGNPPTVP